ncbi:GTP-binding protein Rho1 [Serendipita sp. 399]|nr:GTP-binding protein Rho1 [Serendipita sp. 399]
MRLDLLVYTLIEKVLPEYSHAINLIVRPSGRARDRASWRKEFKHEWKLLAKKTFSSEEDEFPYLKYNPNPHLWLCGCPAFRDSRFLICKHLIQACHRPPPTFFEKVERNRTVPFYSHPALLPKSMNGTDRPASRSPQTGSDDDDSDGEYPPVEASSNSESDSDNDGDDFDDQPPLELTQNYHEEMETIAGEMEDLGGFIRHQIQFGEVRFLSALRQELARARAFYTDIKELEKTENSIRGNSDRLRPYSYHNASVMIICFGIDNPHSWENVEELWAPEIRRFCTSKNGWTPPILLVGCNKDVRVSPEELETLRRDGISEPISVEQGRNMAKRIGAAIYLECSAKTGEGVDDVFQHAARLSLLRASTATQW